MKTYKKHYYTYKITNNYNLEHGLTPVYYIGTRGCDCEPTKDIEYWGSSTPLLQAIKELGTGMFTKEVIKRFYGNRVGEKSAWEHEKQLMPSDLVVLDETYNLSVPSGTPPNYYKNKNFESVAVYKSETTRIKRDNERMTIHVNFLWEYELEGWELMHKPHIPVDSTEQPISPHEELYKKVCGTFDKNKPWKWMHKDGLNKQVNRTYHRKLQEHGWSIGRHPDNPCEIEQAKLVAEYN